MISFWIKSLFLLPGTFLHELMHLIFAVLVGAKVHTFSILPKLISKNGKKHIELGSVGFTSRIKVLDFIISFAPLFLWFMLWVILERIGIIKGNLFNLELNSIKLFSLEYIWIWFVAFQLIIGGIPSSVDFKLAIKGFFSLSGLVVALGTYIYFFQYEFISTYSEPLFSYLTQL